MARVRVYEIAKEFGVESRVVLDRLHELGISAGTASSSLGAPEVRRLTEALGLDATTQAESLISRPFVGHAEPVRLVVFSPDGRMLATAGINGTVRLWNPSTGEELNTINAHPGRVSSVAFAPDGGMLACTGTDGTVRLWNPATGEELNTRITDSQFARSVAFSPDGKTLATAGNNGVRLWNPATGEELNTRITDSQFAQSVAFSPDGKTLATAGDDGVRLSNPATGKDLNILTVPGGWATSVVFSPDSRMLASAGFDGTVRLWSPATGEELHTLNGHSGMVVSLAFSPDGGILASTGVDNTVRLWSPETGKELNTRIAAGQFVRSVAFSPDGRMLASPGNDGVRTWDAATGEELHTIDAKSVFAVAFSPDGDALAGAGPEGVRVWNSRTSEELPRGPQNLAGQQSGASSVAFSHNGTRLAGAGLKGVWMWHSATGRELHILPAQRAFSVMFSPDDTMLASAYADGTVRLCSSTTGEELHVLTGHTASVSSVTFSPDGARLASTGDGTIRIWNPFTGRQQAGTGFGEATRLRPLPGLHSDTASAEDLLGNATDVEMLAMLAAAHDTRPPLAIAVLGQWGAGKSSFMDQMRRQVTQLADLSANNPGRSAFASVVRQVRFNAWHYSDDHLWTGLVDHLFQSLGGFVWIIVRTRGRCRRRGVRPGRWSLSSRSGWRCLAIA